MKRLNKLKRSIRKFFSSKIVRGLLLLILLSVLLIWGVRWCSGNNGMAAKVYVLARNSNWPALNLSGKEPNMLAFLDDLIMDIAENEKLRIHIMTLNQADLFNGLDIGLFDAILTVTTPNPVSEKRYAFSQPIFLAGPVLIVPESSSANSIKDLQGKAVGINRNLPYFFTLNQIPGINLVAYDDIIPALEDLEHGALGGVVMNAQLAYAYTNGFYKGKLKVISAPLNEEGIYLVTLWDHHREHLIEHFNSGLEALHQTGEYDKLLTKWTLINP